MLSSRQEWTSSGTGKRIRLAAEHLVDFLFCGGAFSCSANAQRVDRREQRVEFFIFCGGVGNARVKRLHCHPSYVASGIGPHRGQLIVRNDETGESGRGPGSRDAARYFSGLRREDKRHTVNEEIAQKQTADSLVFAVQQARFL